MQDKQVIVYESYKLNAIELNYPIYEKELLAVIHTLKIWRHYLLESSLKSQIFEILINLI